MPPLIVIENSIIIKQLAIDYIQLSGKHVCLYLHIRQLAHKFCCCPLPFRLIFCQKIVDCFQQGIRRLFPQFRFCLFEFPDAALPVKLYSQFLIRRPTISMTASLSVRFFLCMINAPSAAPSSPFVPEIISKLSSDSNLRV